MTPEQLQIQKLTLENQELKKKILALVNITNVNPPTLPAPGANVDAAYRMGYNAGYTAYRQQAKALLGTLFKSSG